MSARASSSTSNFFFYPLYPFSRRGLDWSSSARDDLRYSTKIRSSGGHNERLFLPQTHGRPQLGLFLRPRENKMEQCSLPRQFRKKKSKTDEGRKGKAMDPGPGCHAAFPLEFLSGRKIREHFLTREARIPWRGHCDKRRGLSGDNLSPLVAPQAA